MLKTRNKSYTNTLAYITKAKILIVKRIKGKMTNFKMFNGIILGALLISSSFLYSQDGALSSYRILLDLSGTKTENPQDSLIGIEFYSGIDGEMNCNVAHIKHTREIIKYNFEILNFEILSMKSGIGSCTKKVKPPTIYIKFVIGTKSLVGGNFEYCKFIPITFETSYTQPQFNLDSLDLSKYLSLNSEAIAIKIDSEKNHTIINQVESSINTMIKFEPQNTKNNREK